MLSTKLLEVLYATLEETAKQAYLMGHRDAKAGKPERDSGFKMSRATRLTVKTALEKQLKSR
jgi:hypothetical protein